MFNFSGMRYRLLIGIFLGCTTFTSCTQQKETNDYQAIVAQDGSGDYVTVQAAINAAPDSCQEPWRIWVKNGSYEEQVIVPQSKSYIHLIGQDKNETVIHMRLNVGGKPQKPEDDKTGFWECSIHNPDSKVYDYEAAVVNVKGDYFYSENISFVNDYGVKAQNGPQALAMKIQGDCAAFYNCIFRSFQDTWMTSKKDEHRLYVKNCFIEGAVDYFYGGGNALLENCILYNVRDASIIVAPCQTSPRFGYVFLNCTVDGNAEAAKGNVMLGRPWHNSPRAVFLHTTMRIPIAKEGWTNMGTVPTLFAEYNSRDTAGNALDLSQRKTKYEGRGENPPKGSCPATISKKDAERYTYENIIMADDGWNPRAYMEE